MPTIDLTTPPPPALGFDALPRRVTLTLAELRLVTDRAGGAPLPFDLVSPGGDGHALEGRLGMTRSSVEDLAYAAALESLHDPASSLERRGLLGGGAEAEGIAGAVGLLATPTTALDIDVTAAGIRARSWHRRSEDAVATLSTVDGIVFELAWFPTGLWAAELGRVGILPEDLPVQMSDVPACVELPFELVDGAAEAIRSGRADLVPVLAAQHSGAVTGADRPLSELEVGQVLSALTKETRGRLRVLVADVSGDETTVVGVVSWTLLADGWHALRPRTSDGQQRVVIDAVRPSDLPIELAPVLAQVIR